MAPFLEERAATGLPFCTNTSAVGQTPSYHNVTELAGVGYVSLIGTEANLISVVDDCIGSPLHLPLEF